MKSGQSLIEVVIALAVVVILAISLVTTSLLTQKTSRAARNNTQATKLVEQSIEQLRIFRDRRGFVGLVNGNCWVLVSTDSNPANWTLGGLPGTTCPETVTLNQTSFSRSILVENGVNANQKRATVTITWTDSGGLQTISNITVFSNCVSAAVAC